VQKPQLTKGGNMGRFYNGDIEGKFMFGVQPSDASERFGGMVEDPSFINYYFEKERDYEGVCKELLKIEKKHGAEISKIDDYFAKNDTWTDEKIATLLGLDKEKAQKVLREYADYKMGIQIKECLEENGSCGFEAEL
jgi:hypothetical protein